jgi:hypothetical protein
MSGRRRCELSVVFGEVVEQVEEAYERAVASEGKAKCPIPLIHHPAVAFTHAASTTQVKNHSIFTASPV